MGRIGTFRSTEYSIFQSLTEEVADSSNEVGSRLSLGHAAMAIAHAISSHKSSGKEVPQQPPQSLVAQHGEISTLWSCAKLAAEAVEARFNGQKELATAKGDDLRFGGCDPKWAQTLAKYEGYFGPSGDRRKIPYLQHQHLDDFVIPVAADAKIALLGDWGTGTDEAVAVLRQLKKLRPDVVIHLGDIYYSGTDRECRRYFLDLLNQELNRPSNPVVVYNLTGNHDMYSGGKGYYGLLPQLNPEPDFAPGQAQQASYFCLRSEDNAWQLLAMDTGLHDHDPFTVGSDLTYLEATEEAWHLDKIRRHSAGGGRTVLLSHHQLFSAFKKLGSPLQKPAGEQAANPKLLQSLRSFQQAAAEGSGDIAAWFWGHEHNLEIYQPYLGLAKGRCLGHGAIPQLVAQSPYGRLQGFEDLPQLVDDPRHPGRPLHLDVVDQAYAHGFALLELKGEGKKAQVSYYQETEDQPMYVEEL